LFGLDAIAFGRHVVVASLDDVEEFAVGAVFEPRRIGEVGDFQILGNLGLGVAGDAVA
jgi:hypothetical protein